MGSPKSQPSTRVPVLILLIAILLVTVIFIIIAFITKNSQFTGNPSPEPSPPTTSVTALLHSTPTPSSSPGLIVYGFVRSPSGEGEAGVDIYRSYASYPGVIIATTATDGYYQSDFYAIPGDEMITVYAVKSGIKYDPEYAYWRHYHGYEITQRDFLSLSP
jgi:hypothetical protein